MTQHSDRVNEQDRLRWLAEIYRTYVTDLQRYIYSKVGELGLAEDLTSTVFLKALRWLHEGQNVEQVRGWLYATARTAIADYWQAQGQYEIRSLAGLEEQLSNRLDDDESAQQQIEARVQYLLSLLSQREREILTLRYLQGYSATEIAQVLGTNAGHIRVLQLRALRRAAQLERQERTIATMQDQTPALDTLIPLLTPESLKVLDLSRQEALTLQHNFVGTEHLLWGLTSEGSLNAFLTLLNVTPERIHSGIVFLYGQHTFADKMAGHTLSSTATPPAALKMLTPRAKQVIVQAVDEMKSQNEQSIRPSHLLLGMLNENEGIGVGLLRSLGVSLLQARASLAPSTTMPTCSFCGRFGTPIKHIFTPQASVSSTTPSAFICDQCVERFHSMLGQV